ncbi:hypothetical protein NDU88_002039 [Pleurodeles waltl]|uniref:Uncharacterized protein n=1 Tax=Pleurodeles waltl TaxID=8319 RepID=A0AAV7UV13_PLEWA|nr:hypothetical protein NDU88_002039 [Pleurodeles waltl]
MQRSCKRFVTSASRGRSTAPAIEEEWWWLGPDGLGLLRTRRDHSALRPHITGKGTTRAAGRSEAMLRRQCPPCPEHKDESSAPGPNSSGEALLLQSGHAGAERIRAGAAGMNSLVVATSGLEDSGRARGTVC